MGGEGELSATLDLFQNWADIQGIEGLESHRFKLDEEDSAVDHQSKRITSG